MKRVFAFLLVGVAVVLVQQTTLATTRTVTSLNDDGGAGTLRTLIADSASGDTINFSVPGTITLTNGEVPIGRDLTIVGPGITISGNNASRVFNISAGTVTISNLTIINGKVAGTNGTGSSPATDGLGGAIYNQGNLTLTGCTLKNNFAIGGDGATDEVNPVGGNGYGGAVYNLGTLLLNSCTINNNIAAGGAGGFDSIETAGDGGSGSGGGIYNQSTTTIFHGVPLQTTFLTLVGCTLNNNSAQGGDGEENFGQGGNGGSAMGGAIINHGGLVMTNCTICANSVIGGWGHTAMYLSGSGGYAAGGGIWNDQHTVTVTVLNCTFSGNSVQGGDGGDGLSSSSNSSGNGGSATGGGVFDSGVGSYLNTIIANDTIAAGMGGLGVFNGSNGSASGPDIDGAITSGGHNFIGKKDGSSGWVGSDLTGTIAAPFNPLLGSLANNGGPTFTLALLPTSAAIDAGDDTVASYLTTDQRGLPRLSGAHVDIGAFEVQTPGTPLLTITYSGNQAVVSWPSLVTGWTLQTNNNLSTGAWGNYLGAIVNNSVTNAPPKGNLFFRLKQ